MKILVTGSAGHLGEGLLRTLRDSPMDVVGLDILASEFTDFVDSVTDRDAVRSALRGAQAVVHAATLHKPHVATHSKQDFIDTNVTGTLVLLEEAVRAGVKAFVFTSSTSVFGHALQPREYEPAVWVTEDLGAIPKNIYGITKLAAEHLCELFSRKHGLPSIILRTSRFFPEEDDDAEIRIRYDSANSKANEFLFRRVDLHDAVEAHILAIDFARFAKFERFIISATTPFQQGDAHALRHDAGAVVQKYYPEQKMIYGRLGWEMFPHLDRVYVNDRARSMLGWRPRYDYGHVLRRLAAREDPRSPLARTVGAKAYHAEVFEDGPYPVE